MGATSFTIEQEIQTRYETAFNTLACRALGEPYNFHRVAPLLMPGMFNTDLQAASILSACVKQFGKNSGYTPQSIALECKLSNTDAIEMSRRDAEMSLPDAMDAFLLYYGQWAEVRISELTKGYILRGFTTEEIQVEQSKERKAMGLTTRLNSSDGKEEFEAELLAALEGKSFVYPVTPHLPGMQKMTGFYEPGDYIVKAALSGVGKTYDAISEIYHNAINNVPSCLINLEVTPKNIQKRIWQKHSQIKFKRDLRGSDAQTVDALRAWDEVKKMPFKSHNPGPTLNAVLSTIRQDYHDRGIQLAVVDYAQLMNIPGYRGNRNYELGEISSALRALALELHIPVIVLAQMKQEVSQRADKKGGMYDIKDCANFAQDATMVQLIHRPSVWGIERDENGNIYPEGYAEFSIVKGRETGCGIVEARFDPVRGFFAPEDTPTQFPVKDTFTIERTREYDKDIPF